MKLNSYPRRSRRNLYHSKCCGGGGKFSILEYRYVAGAVDRICPDYWICVRLDCAWLSGPAEIEREIGEFRTILNIKRGGG
jgi:hypothetical protein